jgi:uncharacterized membrane protein
MPDQPQPKLRRELLGAYVLAVFSIPGILFSLFLTILKFRNEFTCESVLLTTCAGGCSVALNDELSVILGIPLTVYATSFFVVALVVGSIILLSARIGPLMRLLSLLLGWSGLSISLALGVYARLGLGEFCELCAVLYCACTGIFLGAWLINPQGPLQGFRDKARGTVSEAGTIILVAATAFAALTGVQYNRYRTEVLESRKASLLTCQERVSRALPPTLFARDATHEPEVVLGLFIDLSCPHCRNEFTDWLEFWNEHRDFLDLKVFHFPMDPLCRGGNSPGSTRNSACIGALALECMIQAAPAQAEAITLDMFALQDSGVVFFEISKIEDVAKKYGISGIATCVNADSAVEERVFHHVAFARSVPLTEAPAVVVAAVRRGKVSERVSAISGAKDPAMIEDMIEEARLRARSAQ